MFSKKNHYLCGINKNKKVLNFKDIIKLIENDGWVKVDQKGSHRQYKHAIKKGKVTIPVHRLTDELTKNLENSILKQAGLK